MLKTSLFAGGFVAGVVAIPATLIFVKPVRTAISRKVANKIVHTLVNDDKARNEAIEIATEFAVGLAIIDECSDKKGR